MSEHSGTDEVAALRNELQAERRRTEQALRDGEARLLGIVDTAVDGILTIDERGSIEWVNRSASLIFGYDASELIGRNVKLLMPDPYQQEHDQYLKNYRETGQRKIIGIGREVIGRRKDGSTFPVDLAVSEVRLGDRRIFTGIVRDITLRKDAERALVEAKEQAEQASRAKDQFLAVLSHELRTPLTPVLATVTYLERRGNLPDDVRSEIEAIRRNIQLQARLVDDLLDMTRIARGKIELHHEVTDAHAAIRAALQNAQPEIDERGLELTQSLRARQHHIWADPARIQQVLVNLVQNAVKFTPAGGTITVRTRSDDDGKLTIEVADTGVGIEPDAIGRLFRPFEQGERTITRKFGGLGLGLSICKALVDMHQGTITVQSPGSGKGATFTVTLGTTKQVIAPTIVPGPPTSDASRHSFHILLVEDHYDTRRVMAKLLTNLGFVVKAASNVAEARELADQHEYNLLISDIGLPDGSGLDVMQYVKNRGLRGIALSGFGHEEDIRRSRAAGFEMHLVKPINFETLVSVVRKMVAGPTAPAADA